MRGVVTENLQVPTGKGLQVDDGCVLLSLTRGMNGVIRETLRTYFGDVLFLLCMRYQDGMTQALDAGIECIEPQ